MVRRRGAVHKANSMKRLILLSVALALLAKSSQAIFIDGKGQPNRAKGMKQSTLTEIIQAALFGSGSRLEPYTKHANNHAKTTKSVSNGFSLQKSDIKSPSSAGNSNNNGVAMSAQTFLGTASNSDFRSMPSPSKSLAPSPAKSSVPSPSKSSAPLSSKSSAPLPSKSSAPVPSKSSAPLTSKSSAPLPSKSKAPSVPSPSKSSKPSSSVTPKPKPTQWTKPKTTYTAKPKPTKWTKPQPTKWVKPTYTAKPKPTQWSKPQPTKWSKPKTTYTAKPKPTQSAKPQPTKWSKPQPAYSAKPKPTKWYKPKPTQWAKPNPTKWVKPKPTQWTKPKPTQWTKPQPNKWVKPKPAYSNKPKPTKWYKPKPTQWTKPKPTKWVRPKPAYSNKPKPTKWYKPKPTQWSKPKPTQWSKPKPTQWTKPKPTQWTKPKPTQWSKPKPTQWNKPKPTQWTKPKPTQWTKPKPTQWNKPKPTQWTKPKNVWKKPEIKKWTETTFSKVMKTLKSATVADNRYGDPNKNRRSFRFRTLTTKKGIDRNWQSSHNRNKGTKVRTSATSWQNSHSRSQAFSNARALISMRQAQNGSKSFLDTYDHDRSNGTNKTSTQNDRSLARSSPLPVSNVPKGVQGFFHIAYPERYAEKASEIEKKELLPSDEPEYELYASEEPSDDYSEDSKMDNNEFKKLETPEPTPEPTPELAPESAPELVPESAPESTSESASLPSTFSTKVDMSFPKGSDPTEITKFLSENTAKYLGLDASKVSIINLVKGTNAPIITKSENEETENASFDFVVECIPEQNCDSLEQELSEYVSSGEMTREMNESGYEGSVIAFQALASNVEDNPPVESTSSKAGMSKWQIGLLAAAGVAGIALVALILLMVTKKGNDSDTSSNTFGNIGGALSSMKQRWSNEPSEDRTSSFMVDNFGVRSRSDSGLSPWMQPPSMGGSIPFNSSAARMNSQPGHEGEWSLSDEERKIERIPTQKDSWGRRSSDAQSSIAQSESSSRRDDTSIDIPDDNTDLESFGNPGFDASDEIRIQSVPNFGPEADGDLNEARPNSNHL